jgi:GT2 family glycosyltransferase
MSLCAMAIYDTEANGRTWMTAATLRSLAQTVNWSKHRLFLIDNGSCERTRRLLQSATDWIPFSLITSETNLGTAKAINKAWTHRQPGEHCLKVDNDVVISESDWLDRLEEAIELDPAIGIIGLKRKDLEEWPVGSVDNCRSKFVALPHKRGKRWLAVEVVSHVMGTCQLYNSKLLDKIGYLVQPGLYGFDDCISAIRSHLAGFYSCFYPWAEIEHIDPGGDSYCDWKSKYAGVNFESYDQLRSEYLAGTRNIYHSDEELRSF